MIRQGSFLLLLVGLTLSLASCDDKEQDNLAKAQQCLDKIDQNTPTSADACMEFIESYDSQQANIIKCGITLTSGGLVDSKIVQAANVLSDESVANKEAVYMTIFALDTPATTGFTKANKAEEYCQASGVPGFKYISSLVLAGTTLAKMLSELSITVTITDPSSVNTAITDLLTQCNVASPTTPPAACTDPENAQALGETAMTLASGYCNSQEADSEVCHNFTEAVDAAGSDPDAVGVAVLCYLNRKTYNVSTGQCN